VAANDTLAIKKLQAFVVIKGNLAGYISFKEAI
jgi:hypothetical protein